ncbi:MAG: hypothetical protein MUD03_17440 [Pirellula sp.]|nr:hypothetical protein [Pirellula sp.]
MKRLLLLTLLSTAVMDAKTVLANDGYSLPPKEIVDIIDAKPEPTLALSPDSRWMIFWLACESIQPTAAPFKQASTVGYRFVRSTPRAILLFVSL